MAKRLKLKGKDVDLPITVVRGQTSKMKSKLYTISLIDLHGRRMRAQVLGIDKISSEIAAINCEQISSMFNLEPKC